MKVKCELRSLRYWTLLLAMGLCLAGTAEANGRKPPEEKPKPKPSATLKEAKDGANRALDTLDQDIHQALPEMKNAGNKALQAVDDTVHGRK